ncbi:flagellar hook-length control protein FliK [Marinobacter sp.]|uniref:flagellar hook-length control protein FliK n=1 Tax=Marinobacter sp. TaxID=50741 RepID=UPI003565750B
MKLPHGNPIPPQPSNRPATAPAGARQDPVQQLRQLQLENRQAVVARVAELLTQRGSQQAVLDVRGQRVTVELPVNGPELKAGDLIRLMREGQSLTLLDKLPATAETRLGQALLRHLPWQQNLDSGLTRLLAALSGGMKGAPATGLPGTSESLPAPVREALQAIARLMPGASTDHGLPSFRPVAGQPLTSSGSGAAATGQGAPLNSALDATAVKQWLASSGVLAEAGLARGMDQVGPTDLKLALGRLALTLLQHQNLGSDQFTRFTPMPSQELITAPLQFPSPSTPPVTMAEAREPVSPGQMLRLLAGMLNRITVNQLHSQLLTTRAGGDAGTPASTLITDLPWMAPGGEVKTAQLRIDHEKPDQQGPSSPRKTGVAEWRLSLAMDLDEAGRVFFDVALRQSAVSARVWAEQQDTARLVTRQLGDLRTRLTELGLEVSELECRRGQPPVTPTRLEHRLLDTRA